MDSSLLPCGVSGPTRKTDETVSGAPDALGPGVAEVEHREGAGSRNVAEGRIPEPSVRGRGSPDVPPAVPFLWRIAGAAGMRSPRLPHPCVSLTERSQPSRVNRDAVGGVATRRSVSAPSAP